MKGIYQYMDLNTNDVVYIGRDSRIDINRRFMYSYRYLDENKKQREILSVNIKKLEKKVKAKGLIWRKIE